MSTNQQFRKPLPNSDLAYFDARAACEAIKPGYATLVKNIDGYNGRTMGYKCYVVSVTQSGNGWILKMALSKKASGYAGIILVTTNDEPTAAVDSRVMMYGRCVGMSESGDSTEGSDTTDATATTSESYPCFELLLMSAL